MTRIKNATSPVGSRLRELRVAMGYSQSRLGTLAGLDDSVAAARINQYEKGVHEPNFSLVQKVAQLLNVPTAYFYAEDSELAEVIQEFGRLSATKKARALRDVRKL